MGIRSINSWRGSVVVSAVAAGALLLAGLGGGAALAGDVAGNAGDNLSVTGATAGVLPQTLLQLRIGHTFRLACVRLSQPDLRHVAKSHSAEGLYATAATTSRPRAPGCRLTRIISSTRTTASSCVNGSCTSRPIRSIARTASGMYGNEFYNQYTVRDAWWQNKWGPLTTYVGNQIVVWGQSLAFRVGDVVNPD